MSISLSASIPIQSQQQQGWYARATRFAQRYISPRTMDRIDFAVVPFLYVASLLGYKSLINGWKSLFVRLRPRAKETLIHVIAFTIAYKCMDAYRKYIVEPFIRYEINNVVKNSKMNELSALVFHTTQDHNNAFFNHQVVDLYQKLSNTFSIDLMMHSDSEKRDEALSSNLKKYERIYVLAHGDQNGFELGPANYVFKQSKPFFKWIQEHADEGGIIAYYVCEAGKGENNIARQTSRFCSHATVLASSTRIHAITGVEHDDEAIPSFNNGIFRAGNDTTRIYLPSDQLPE